MTRREVLKIGTKVVALTSVLPEKLVRESVALTRNDVEMSADPLKKKSFAPAPENSSDICDLRAVEMARLIHAKKLSSREVVAAHLKRIQSVNTKVNAIVTLVPEEQLMAQALAADESLAQGKWQGPLHGMPVAAKDLHETKGIRTTFGSPLFRDHVPDFDCLVVEREKKAGAIVIGKSNVPEFGFGSQTFNKVFGASRNPYDLTRTCGGSTGGGAVAVACGMVPLADGSDMGGSLRNPPNFCGVVGIRPSPGRVPNTPARLGWQTLSVAGPVARNVEDCAFFLSLLAGFDSRSPIAIDQPGEIFAKPLERDFNGVRVAMGKDLGLPWDPQVQAAVEGQRKVLESMGCLVEEAEPDLRDAGECFVAWRHWSVELAFGDILASKGDQLNEYVRWHVEQGRKLTGSYLARVEAKRTSLYERMRTFMEKYEFFVLPVNQVLPFDANLHFPTEIAGVKMENYMAWMKSCYYISAAGNPAASVPCAFSKEGLPIGMQIVGRHHDDWGVLQIAHAFERAAGVEKPVLAALKS